MIKYYLSSDSVLTESDILISELEIVSLNRGEMLEIDDILTIPENVDMGNWNLIIELDGSEILDEINEDNNLALVPMEINEPSPVDLIVSPAFII